MGIFYSVGVGVVGDTHPYLEFFSLQLTGRANCAIRHTAGAVISTLRTLPDSSLSLQLVENISASEYASLQMQLTSAPLDSKLRLSV